MKIIKTDLVDIVNDGEVGNEYTVYDDLVGVYAISRSEALSLAEGTSKNTFKLPEGRYRINLNTTDRTVTATATNDAVTSYDANEANPMYIIGEVNGKSWAANYGVPMTTYDGVNYEAVIEITPKHLDENNPYNYFGFSTVLANDNDDGAWEYVNSNRLGATEDGTVISLDDNSLFAKDLNKFRNKSAIQEGQNDFNGKILQRPCSSYDQSNWVELRGLSNPEQYVGYFIKGNTITGTLTNKVNPTMTVTPTSTPVKGSASPYSPNLYIMPNFNSAYYTFADTENAPEDFFVAPKPQEYADIQWATYDSDGNFYVPDNYAGQDESLAGGISVNWNYLPSHNPIEGHVYKYDAIIRATEPAEASSLKAIAVPVDRKTDKLSTEHLVYPLHLEDFEDFATAITTVPAGGKTQGKVVSTRYYNLTGVESATPFQGINIVVEELDNGTRRASKIIK